MDLALFHRHGAPVTTAVRTDEKGKPFTMIPRACGRCGGLGGGEQWRHTGWTCFDCGGSGDHINGPKLCKLYTAEEIEKLNASKAKRDAKKLAAAEAKAAADKVEAEARRADFMTIHGALLAKCEPFAERSKFIADVLSKALDKASLTENQVAALENVIAKIEAEDARKGNAKHVGAVGERLRGLFVTVKRIASFDNHFGTFHITTLRDDDGNTFVVKSSSFRVREDDKLCIDGTVKAHDSFRDEPQTQLARVTVHDRVVAEERDAE